MRATLADYRARAAQVAAIDVIFDAPATRTRRSADGTAKRLAQERYFNDLYAVFLHKLSAFVLQRGGAGAGKEKERLQALFGELMKAKEVLG